MTRAEAIEAAARNLDEWHEHAMGCPLAEVEIKAGAGCDCGLLALRAALAMPKEDADV